MLYRNQINRKTKLRGERAVEGETIEAMIRRMIENGEGIRDMKPLIYTERKDGVVAATNIRTDKFEEAIKNLDNVSETIRKRRAENIEAKLQKDNPPKTGITGEGGSQGEGI